VGRTEDEAKGLVTMYRIEIQAETLSELAQRMVLMGAQLQRDGVTDESAEPEPKAKSKPAAKTEEKSAPSLSFEQDVTSRVLRLVKAKGKVAVTDILEGFGVSRARQVNESDWPALVKQLDEALA
jgi:hypothetical protein